MLLTYMIKCPILNYSIYFSASLNKAISLQNHLGARTNFNVQRFAQPTIPANNSFLPDYTATLVSIYLI